MSIYSKEFSKIHMAFFEFAHILWEESEPTIVLTDKKQSNVSSNQKLFHHIFKTHAIMCCKLIPKKQILLVQSAQQLTISPD